jgi:hypothetical protein
MARYRELCVKMKHGEKWSLLFYSIRTCRAGNFQSLPAVTAAYPALDNALAQIFLVHMENGSVLYIIRAHRGIEWVPMTADGSYPIVFSDKSRIFA